MKFMPARTYRRTNIKESPLMPLRETPIPDQIFQNETNNNNKVESESNQAAFCSRI